MRWRIGIPAFLGFGLTLSAYGVDGDGDDIPAVWETAHYMDDSNPDDADSDFDRDGLSARQEYFLSLQSAGEGPLGHWSVTSESLSYLNAPGNNVNLKSIITINDRSDVLVNVTSYNSSYPPTLPVYRYAAWVRSGIDGTWRKLSTVQGVPAASLVGHDLNDEGQVVGIARLSSVNGGNSFGFLKGMRDPVHTADVEPWYDAEFPSTPVRSITAINDWGGHYRNRVRRRTLLPEFLHRQDVRCLDMD